MTMNVSVNPTITSLPWSFGVQAPAAAKIVVKVDEIIEAASNESALFHVSYNSYTNGVHFMTVEVVTAQGAQGFKVLPLQFALNGQPQPPPAVVNNDF